MINLLAIDHVVFRVKDIEAMTAFYETVLGAHVEKRQEEFGLVQLRAGQALIDLLDCESELGRQGGAAPGPEGRNVDHICLRVMPWDEAAIRAHLVQHGVEAGATGSRYGAEGYGPSLYFQDPEGNTIELKGPPWPPERPKTG